MLLVLDQRERLCSVSEEAVLGFIFPPTVGSERNVQTVRKWLNRWVYLSGDRKLLSYTTGRVYERGKLRMLC